MHPRFDFFDVPAASDKFEGALRSYVGLYSGDVTSKSSSYVLFPRRRVFVKSEYTSW